MNRKLVEKIFPASKLNITKIKQDEILEGSLKVGHGSWKIRNGIVFVPIKSKTVLREQRAVHLLDKKPESGGLSQGKYSEALLKLPFSDLDNPYFRRPGYFRNVNLVAKEFGQFLTYLKKSRKKLIVLELGSDKGWASAQIARLGHQVIGLDINHHLKQRDFWRKNGARFDCVQVDMNELPFKEGAFDLVFAAAAIHHSSNLKKTAHEIWRVLKPGGRFLFLGEPIKGNLWKGDFGEEQKKLGINENIYSFKEWQSAFKKAGFNDLKLELTDLGHLTLWPVLSAKEKLVALAREIKKSLLKFLPFLRIFTSSSYSFSGKKN